MRNGSCLKVRVNTNLMTAMTRNTPLFLSVLCGAFVLVPVSFESGPIPSYHSTVSIFAPPYRSVDVRYRLIGCLTKDERAPSR